MPIKIKAEDVRGKKDSYPKIRRNDWATILRTHFINVVEDTFVLYHDKEMMTPELNKKWEKFKEILERRL